MQVFKIKKITEQSGLRIVRTTPTPDCASRLLIESDLTLNSWLRVRHLMSALKHVRVSSVYCNANSPICLLPCQ